MLWVPSWGAFLNLPVVGERFLNVGDTVSPTMIVGDTVSPTMIVGATMSLVGSGSRPVTNLQSTQKEIFPYLFEEISTDTLQGFPRTHDSSYFYLMVLPNSYEAHL